MKIGKYRITFTEPFDSIVGGIGVLVGMAVIIAICCFVL